MDEKCGGKLCKICGDNGYRHSTWRWEGGESGEKGNGESLRTSGEYVYEDDGLNEREKRWREERKVSRG